MFPATGTKLSVLLNCQICPSCGFGLDQIRLFQAAPGHSPAVRTEQRPSPEGKSDMPHPDLIVLESKRVNSSSTSFTCCSSQCQRTVPGHVNHSLRGLFSCLSCIKDVPVKTFYFSILFVICFPHSFKSLLATIFLTTVMFHFELCGPFCSRDMTTKVFHMKRI